MNAQPITRPDNPFNSLLSACFACIVFLHLRQNSCFAMLWTNDCGSIDGSATPQILEAFQSTESSLSQSASASM
jgi:hypothetical protein